MRRRARRKVYMRRHVTRERRIEEYVAVQTFGWQYALRGTNNGNSPYIRLYVRIALF